MKKVVYILLFISSQIFSQKAIPTDTLLQNGISLIYKLDFESAERHFRNIIADYPDYPGGKFFLAMCDWWKILINLDNTDKDEIFFDKLEDIIFQCDEILKQNPNNEIALFFKAGAIGYRGRLRALRDSWLKAADDALSAYPLIEKLYQLNPKNIDVLLGFGIYNYYLSVVPDKFPIIKPFLSLFPKGDKNLGLEQLINVANNGKFSRYEAMYFLMTSFLNYEQLPYKAFEYSRILYETFPENVVFQRYYAKLNYITWNIDNAIDVYEKLINIINADKIKLSFSVKREIFYYAAVSNKIKRDYLKAEIYFKKSIEMSNQLSDKNSGFLALSKLYLANIYDIMKRRQEAIALYKEVLKIPDYKDSHSYAQTYLNNPYNGE
jgi:tetratricopeptide (TPR) repeat protein